MMIPLRHCRPHVGFATLLLALFAGTGETLAEVCRQLCSLIDQGATAVITVIGLVWDPNNKQYVCVPEDLSANPPMLWTLALTLSKEHLHINYHGIMFGSGARRTQSLPTASVGQLYLWQRHHPSTYRVHTVSPEIQHSLDELCNADNTSFLMFYQFLDAQGIDDRKADRPDTDSLDTGLR